MGDAGAEGSEGDRRSDPRIAKNFRVKYPSLDDFVVAYTSNISRGGMFVLTDDPLAVGTVVQVSLELPDEESDHGPVVPCVARVAYVEDGRNTGHAGMGLELIDVPSGIIQELLMDALSESAPPEEEGDSTSDAKLLVVEDDPTYRQHLIDVLQLYWPNALSAPNGLEGLGMALRLEPDLILSDVEMPQMNGWQFLRIVRSRPKLAHVPVIFLTALRGESERLRGYRLGVDDYVNKPVDPHELHTRVRGQLLRARGVSAARHDLLRGDLSHVSLASVLSFIHQEGRSGHLLVISGRRLATLMIRQGNVLRVHLSRGGDGRDGLERLFQVLEWERGRFELADGEVEADDEIGLPTNVALLHWAQWRDENLD
ncbi:MAG: response regulator [Myxococcota bacterium]